ncbi:MAG: hypothetical protein AAGB12_10155 [Pseudomonadota bacterium]
MVKQSKSKNKRRQFLKVSAALPLIAGIQSTSSVYAKEEIAPASERRFLFVFGATGGASIIDSFLPILDTESNTGNNTFTSDQIQQPDGSNLRCPIPLENSIQGAIPLGDGYNLATFLSKHVADAAVFTQEVSSVNHFIASRRSVTGDNINGGRTLQEAVAAKYGSDLLLPSCNMAGDSYGGNGEDDTLPVAALGEMITDARSFAFSTHGYQGLANTPNAQLITKARNVRAQLEAASNNAQALSRRRMVNKYLGYRDTLQPQIESANLINKLLLMQTTPDGQPLASFGLVASAEGEELLQRFPNLASDSFEAQTALSYLLVKNGISNVVTLAPSGSPFITPEGQAMTSPLAFDWSHLDHRGAQNAMWGRIMNMVDNLIDLLKATEFAEGQSLWDRSMVYIATEFGRDKISEGGSGHDLNNGNLLISPFINGNRVYGGVEPNSALTYGFNPTTGEPAPGTLMKEGDIYSAICHAMDIDFQGRKDFPAVVKSNVMSMV